MEEEEQNVARVEKEVTTITIKLLLGEGVQCGEG